MSVSNSSSAKTTRPPSILDEEDDEARNLNVSGNEVVQGNGTALNPPTNVLQPNYFQSEGILVPVQLSPTKTINALDTSPSPQNTSESGCGNYDDEEWDW